MKHQTWILIGLAMAACLIGKHLIIREAAGGEEVPIQSRLKVAVLDKRAKGESARRLGIYYPMLTQRLREDLAQDLRFTVISQEEIDRALASLEVTPGEIDPSDTARLREIGKRVGADLVFVSYFYEMSCHGGPPRSENVLSFVGLNHQQGETIRKAFTQEISAAELAASDIHILRELLKRVEGLSATR